MRKLLSKFSFGLLGLLFPAVTNAQVALLPECAVGSGRCSTCDMMVLFLNFAELLTIWVSGAVLFSFVWGGVLWITSGGKSERVQRGQQVMIGAVVGLFLVGGGYTIVNYSIGALVGQEDLNEVQLFGTNWNEFCEDRASVTGTASNDTASSSTSVCEGQPDGTACTEEGEECSVSGQCACRSGNCISTCYSTLSDEDPSASTYCVDTVGTCTGLENIVVSESGECPASTPVCCQKVTSCQRESESDCSSIKCVGQPCVPSPGTPSTGYVCGRGDQAGQCVSGCQFNYSTTTAFCLPQGNACPDGFLTTSDDSFCPNTTDSCCVKTTID